MSKSRIIVVGAGISGLTAAWHLRKLGHEVVVLENADHVGGKMASVERDDFRIGRGAAVCAASYSAFLNLVGELGLGQHVTTPKPVAGVMRNGKAHWFRGAGFGMVLDFLRTPLLSIRSKLLIRRLLVDVYRNRKWIGYDPSGCARLDTESVGEYCERRLTP